MNMESNSLIQTGIDKLITIVEERGRISLPSAAKEMGVSSSVVEGWVKFLEEEDLITIEYRLTVPYLVYKKLSRREVLNKAKEFKNKKEIFLSKASISLNFLEKEGEKLKKSKSEFDRLKKELGFEIEKVRDELTELEKFEKLKTELDGKLKEQKKDMEDSFKAYDDKMKESHKRYEHLLEKIEKEETTLVDEEKESLALEEQEERIYKKMETLKESIQEVEDKLKGKGDIVKQYKDHIQELKDLAGDIKKDLITKKESLLPIVEEAKAKEKEIENMQDIILQKLSSHKKDIKETQEVTSKFERFFDQKLKIEELLTKINKDRDDLEKTLRAVVRKAQAFQITGKEKDVGKNIVELEKMFGEVNKKKSFFEEELRKLKSLIK